MKDTSANEVCIDQHLSLRSISDINETQEDAEDNLHSHLNESYLSNNSNLLLTESMSDYHEIDQQPPHHDHPRVIMNDMFELFIPNTQDEERMLQIGQEPDFSAKVERLHILRNQALIRATSMACDISDLDPHSDT